MFMLRTAVAVTLGGALVVKRRALCGAIARQIIAANFNEEIPSLSTASTQRLVFSEKHNETLQCAKPCTASVVKLCWDPPFCLEETKANVVRKMQADGRLPADKLLNISTIDMDRPGHWLGQAYTDSWLQSSFYIPPFLQSSSAPFHSLLPTWPSHNLLFIVDPRGTLECQQTLDAICRQAREHELVDLTIIILNF
jgi:hypothetical protein